MYNKALNVWSLGKLFSFIAVNWPWPLGKPVNSTTINQRREHTAASTECISHRTHAQYHMKVIPNTADEVIEHGIPDIEENDKKFKTLHINKTQP